MSKLKSKGRQFTIKSELFRLGPNLCNCCGICSNLNGVDGGVHPLAALGVSIALRGSRTSHGKGAVITGSISVKGMNNVKESLITWPDDPVREIMWVRITSLSRNCIDCFDLV